MESLYESFETVREARARYFVDNAFGPDGGYGSPWVMMKAGPIPIAIPNAPSRVRAVRFHDLHHIATGYPTTWIGEAEISAWELATGCADHYAAWVLNLLVFPVGFFLSPRRLFRAFVRGRHSRNLYRTEFGDALLDLSVSELRRQLELDGSEPRATVSDLGWFLACTLVSFPLWTFGGLVTLAAIPFAVPILRRNAHKVAHDS